MRIKLFLRGVLTLAVLLICPSVVGAQLSTTAIYAGGALAPFITGEAGGPMTGGRAATVIKRVFNELNVPLTTLVTPFNRAIGMAKRGQSDVVFPVVKNAADLEFLRYSKPLYVSRSVMLSALDRKDALEWRSDNTLSGMTVGLLRGYLPSEAFRPYAQGRNLKIVSAKDVATLFRLIRLGRIDFTILDEISAKHLLAHNSNWASWIKIGKRSVYDQKMSIGIAKTSSIVRQMVQIDQLIDRLKSSGELQTLFLGP